MNEEQALLADGEWNETSLVQAEHKRGVFSGKNLQSSDPERFNLIVQLIAENKMSGAQIAAATKCSRNLVAGIRIHCPEEIEQTRVRLSKKAAVVADMCLDRQIEALADPDTKIPFQQLAVGGAVNIDKLQVLSGGATARLEVVDARGPEHDDFMREMGLGAGTPPAKGARVIDVEAVETRRIGPAADADPDEVSNVRKGGSDAA